MEIALTNDEEVLMNLLSILPILPICEKIIQLKNRREKEDTFNYHVERWTTLSSIYFRSFEISNNLGISNPSPSLFEHKKYISYTINDEKYVSGPDTNLDYYHETGISYQVRDLLMSILKTKDWEKQHWKEIREGDDKLYYVLSGQIMKKTQDKYNSYLKYTPSVYSDDKLE